MKKMIIKPITRIEGHGQLEIFSSKDKLSRVNFSMLDYRGIEKILIGKNIFEIPRLVSKVCGFCAAAHMVASCKAFEKILDIELSYTATLQRQLVLMGEMITNHTIHFAYMALPDLLRLAGGRVEVEIGKKINQLIKIGKNLIEIVGGRSVQPVSIIIGGMSKSLNEKEISLLKKNLKRGPIDI